MKTRDSYKIIVIGAGTAGLSSTAHLLRNVPLLKESIAIIDPSKTLLSATMEFSGEELFQRKVRCVIRNRLFQKGQRGS